MATKPSGSTKRSEVKSSSKSKSKGTGSLDSAKPTVAEGSRTAIVLKMAPGSALISEPISESGSTPGSRKAGSAVKKEVRNFKFDKERIVFGSVISADVRLTGEGISPIHAVMERTRDQPKTKEGEVAHSSFTLFDLGSTTGVTVNGEKIIAHELKAKDKIKLGKYQFIFTPESFDPKTLREETRQVEGRTLFLNPGEDLKPLLLEEERFVEEIFDYRPDSKKALEVVMSWCGTILTVEHFVHQKTITMGHGRKNDFGIPPLLTESNHPVVVQSKSGYTLNIDPKMDGVVQHAGQLDQFESIKESAMRGSHGFEIPFHENDFAKVSIGDLEFYFSFTAAPPRLKRRRLMERDPFFQKIFGTSMVFTALLMGALLNLPAKHMVEAEQMPDRIATILYQPEKFMKPPEPPKSKPKPVVQPPAEAVQAPPPAPKPVAKKVIRVNEKPVDTKKPLPKVMDYHSSAPKNAPKVPHPPAAQPAAHNRPAPKATAHEGEGAKAKGASGTRGEKQSVASKEHTTALDRPSPNAGNKGASGNSQVSDEGNVDLLKGSGGQIKDILGGSGAHLGEGSQNLKGFGNFGTRGSGGLALSGQGTGGGGTAETTLGGLGRQGSGMGRVGTGKGAAGNGSGIVGSQIRVDIRSDGPEEAIVMGAMDRNAVAEAIYAHRDEFRLCYEREINADTPSLAGTVATSFVIGSSGRVTEAGVESSSLHHPATERCVLKVLKRIEFPMPKGGGVVEVKFPFKFSAASH